MAFGAVQITVADDDWVGCQVIDTDEIDCWADIELGFLKVRLRPPSSSSFPRSSPSTSLFPSTASSLRPGSSLWSPSLELCVDGFCVELTDVLITPDGFQACIELTLEEGIVNGPSRLLLYLLSTTRSRVN
eukprot:gnl/Ergobibamus_cyprinoides/5082.p1 GENE.gnl/Ergobibamus_cyprinoides/5082~~gnl/Ergobibamus_cyprinoides/5082.p1  ORF type:complete len:152 (+),score=33.84 gnl/Ergobibamus_cyprinoides/5082:65-457(+)